MSYFDTIRAGGAISTVQIDNLCAEMAKLDRDHVTHYRNPHIEGDVYTCYMTPVDLGLEDMQSPKLKKADTPSGLAFNDGVEYDHLLTNMWVIDPNNHPRLSGPAIAHVQAMFKPMIADVRALGTANVLGATFVLHTGIVPVNSTLVDGDSKFSDVWHIDGFYEEVDEVGPVQTVRGIVIQPPETRCLKPHPHVNIEKYLTDKNVVMEKTFKGLVDNFEANCGDFTEHHFLSGTVAYADNNHFIHTATRNRGPGAQPIKRALPNMALFLG